jgi:hypothetical protein
MQATSLSIAQLARRYGLIALMLFVLAGVQVIQASPLHDHTQHSVDCGLCHVPVADAPPTHHGIVPEFETLSAALPALASAFFSSRNPSPYQGRAPPALLF